MRIAISLVALVLFSLMAHAATIYVPDHYSTIQDAINGAANGDTIVVRPGTYTENIDFFGKAVTVKSELGPAVTAIDGNQVDSVVTASSGEQADSVLDGFTVTNGHGYRGGGIYCVSSSPSLVNNIVTGNSALTYCGGIYNDNASPLISGNVITGNYAEYSGGGIYCLGDSRPTIVGNVVSDNIAMYRGGGIYCENSPAGVINNMIVNNWAGYYGGGIHFRDTATVTVTSNTVFGNYADYYGGGISCENSSPTIMNMILWDNVAGYGSGHEYYFYSNANPTLTYSDVKGGAPGTGNIDADPLFVEPGTGDFHLTWGSPCIDVGSNITYPEDFEGDPRIHLGNIDMGADEFHPHLFHVGAVVPGNTVTLKVIGTPSAPVTLGLGAGIQDPPISTQYGYLMLQMPVLQLQLGAIPGNGILVFPGTVPFFWISGELKPLQALIGPLGDPTSVLTNLDVMVVE